MTTYEFLRADRVSYLSHTRDFDLLVLFFFLFSASLLFSLKLRSDHRVPGETTDRFPTAYLEIFASFLQVMLPGTI